MIKIKMLNLLLNYNQYKKCKKNNNKETKINKLLKWNKVVQIIQKVPNALMIAKMKIQKKK